MLIEVKCPGCAARSQVDSSFAGVKRPCPSCGRVFTIERPALKAPEPKKNPHLVDAVCPKCGASERVSAVMAGAPRACKQCRQLFTVQVPVERAEELEKLRLAGAQAELGPKRYELGCPACFRVYLAPSEGPATIRCPYCGAAANRTDARAWVPALEEVRRSVIGALLEGKSPRAIASAASPSLAAATAHTLTLIQPQLPALRSRALDAQNRGEPVTLGAPGQCDRCAMPAALHPLRLGWARVVNEERKVHAATALTILAGVVVTEKKQELERLEEVAYLCERCSERPPPPAPGYQLGLKRDLPPLTRADDAG
jgi:transposase-like protein